VNLLTIDHSQGNYTTSRGAHYPVEEIDNSAMSQLLNFPQYLQLNKTSYPSSVQTEYLVTCEICRKQIEKEKGGGRKEEE
jgi:hypothetical protein